MNTRQRRGHVVHRSLTRNPLLLGVESEFVGLEALLVWGVVVLAGPSLLTLAVAGTVWSVLHPLFLTMGKRDEQMFRVYVRSLGHQSYFPAHALQRALVPPFTNRFPGRKG